MTEPITGVFGSRSFVADALFSLASKQDQSFIAFSRGEIDKKNKYDNIQYRLLSDFITNEITIKYWISLAPIWILVDYFDFLESYGVQRIVVLSSSSRYTKINASSIDDRNIACQIINAEHRFVQWAEQRNIEWIVLRPTMIYETGKDKNISLLLWFIDKFGFFPILGKANGKRQPIHAEDVAIACMNALNRTMIKNRGYTITGAETLTYDQMLKRIFQFLGKKVYLFHIPLTLFKTSIGLLKFFDKFRNLNISMVERMNQDLIFDCSDAKKDINFSPRPFILDKQDIS